VEFSLFYVADDSDAASTEGRYRLLLEGARFADDHDFAAVWVPERHFHRFGGLYPNPSVLAAALATVTRRVSLRAGSVVLPLHDPLRVVEEWAVVDNLSGGRVGASFASGWHAVDFALRPEAYRHRRETLRDGVQAVRALWRGEPVERLDGAGARQQIVTYPRPITEELPVWIASSGNVDTFRLAGDLRANLLTNLLSQNLDAVAQKIGAYRSARRAAGGGGHVTLMLHTLLGDDRDEVRHNVREPLANYLCSSFDLLMRSTGWFGADLDPSSLRPADIALLVDHAFDRYFETSGLLGDLEKARTLVKALHDIGVDEIACLIDFGVPHDLVLASLEHLAELQRWAATS
jgi:natural product biosynthesis luciferase-like monooxygenase protein